MSANPHKLNSDAGRRLGLARVFFYDKLGEVAKNIRTFALPYETKTYTFAMKYEHDSRKNCASQMKRRHNFFSVSHFAIPLPTINCQLSTVNWTHTFSAKEKDTETGLSYFGARYYSSDLSIWLSVDPMSDKYPSLSPYTYCANNPIKLVDPNGEEVYIRGDAVNDAVSQLNNKTSDYFKVVLKDAKTGELTYEGKARSRTDRLIKKAIDSKKEIVHIEANNSNFFIDRNGKTHKYTKDNNGGDFYGGGAYGGSEVTGKRCDSYQYVNPNALSKLDEMVGDHKSGGYMLHEFAEAFFSAKLGHASNGDPVGGNNYEEAHSMANMYSGGGWKASMVDVPINTRIGFMIFSGRIKIGYIRSYD